MPIGVSRTVEFTRPVTDEEWEQLVASLRRTFNAQGRVWNDRNYPQWANGNLRAVLEPTERGHRLRLSTVKGNARSLFGFGASLLGAGIAAAAFGGVDVALGLASLLGLVGGGTLAATALQLPRWARTRAVQMEAITAEAAARSVSVPDAQKE